MEMMGVVFRTYELRGGSSGSCVAEECWLGWKALSTDLVAAKYTQAGPFPLVYYYQGYILLCFDNKMGWLAHLVLRIPRDCK